jgi:hypothetical protein
MSEPTIFPPLIKILTARLTRTVFAQSAPPELTSIKPPKDVSKLMEIADLGLNQVYAQTATMDSTFSTRENAG